MRLRKSFLSGVVVALIALTLVKSSFGNEPCAPANSSVTIPVKVHIFFAGTPPLFMRENWNLSTHRDFLHELTATVNHEALPFDVEPFTPIIKRLHPHACSVLKYDYTYDMATADLDTVKRLDSVLSKILKEADAMFVDATTVADAFFREVNSDQAFHPSMGMNEYNLLVYNALAIAPQYGFRGEVGGAVSTMGIASENRFAFIDVGARPYFLGNPGTLSPGEELMSLSASPKGYAKKMHSISFGLFTPRTSERMRRFPHETRLAFRLFLVDVSSVIGRKSGVAGDSLGNRPLGATFDAEEFAVILRRVFQDPALSHKKVSIEVETVDMDTNAVIAMAVIRSFTMKGLQMILDSDQLYKDVVLNATNDGSYFVDSSFVAHVPLYLFSIADDSRSTHFDTGEEARTKVVGKQAVFMVENRLRDEKDEHLTVTSEAAKEVLELLCGLGDETLSFMNVKDGNAPLLVRDIARRNVLTQELDWSEVTASWKAIELLNYEGLDSRLIPHGEGSIIYAHEKSVKQGLRELHNVWIESAQVGSPKGIEGATLDLVERNEKLASKLHEELCNQPLPEEILIKAEAELEVAMEDAKRESVGSGSSRSDAWFIVLPGIAGIVFGTYLHRWLRMRGRSRGPLLDEIPGAGSVRNFDVSVPTQWFSTLTASDKSKVN